MRTGKQDVGPETGRDETDASASVAPASARVRAGAASGLP